MSEGLRKKIIASLVTILVGLSPVFYHLGSLRIAQQEYNFMLVQQELGWFQDKSGLNSLPMVRDARWWLELNTGRYSESLQPLQEAQDDRYLFWRFELSLKEGQPEPEILKLIQDPVLAQLANGMLALANQDALTAWSLLSAPDTEWSSLPEGQESLRHLLLAQAALMLDNREEAQVQLERFSEMSPDNPAYATVAFNQALQSGQWELATELMKQIDTAGWRRTDPEYLTQKALLALNTDAQELWEQTLIELEDLNTPGYLEYVLGIEAYVNGDAAAAAQHLEQALNLEIAGMVKSDAEQALVQARARLEAQPSLDKVMSGTGY